ncbi:Mu transposase C-terminal domain-containing protein [Rhizobium sullae]|uniref:Mu transposase C-terminal domain-containing protein n=1 Tax=Rhizobium sullae TaxID=50338 RepID=A0ABY5XFB5_RHISU|nr:transposase domain-containing protein [Rhizobium sullae]UWU13247.1 Mu transposase C-terminal domain-containing protein [Rhizobium sullae]
MKEFFTVAELAAANLPDLPRAEKSLDNFARARWRGDDQLARKAPGKTKPVWEYHYSLLPPSAQTRLVIVHDTPANDRDDASAVRKAALWARYEGLSHEHKAICEWRLNTIVEVESLERVGVTSSAAIAIATKKAGCSKSAYYEWREMLLGTNREDWLAALAPSFRTEGARADCDERAWDYLKSDYLRPEAPAFSECYRRMAATAAKHGWAPIAAERTLRRRLNATVSKAVQTLARKGRETAKKLYPAQRRLRQHLHAMQMVNMDGHKLDVFVKVPWSEKPVRMFLLGIQDLYSGKIVGWRLSDSENKETVRLVIGDMVENFGVPDAMFLDNGRAFASKWISGGVANRFRFKVRDEDPQGLLVTLGVELHWTTPYSGQSKPIERAWRDLAEKIAKHPFCAGAYVGNKPDAKPENYGSRAIPLDGFRAHVSAQIAAHNAQLGRTGGDCKGRSFDQTFADSMGLDSTIVRWPTAAQKSLWLLASEVIRAKKGSGEIHFQGNRYWSRELNQFAGQKVTIRFDPDNLHQVVKVYDLSNVLICDADCIEDAGFNDQEAARHHARKRRDYAKAVTAERDAHAALSASQLSDLYYKGDVAEPAPKPEPIRPRVTRLATAAAVALKPAAAISEDEVEDTFSKALARISGGASIIEFPQGNTPTGTASGANEPKRAAYGSRKKKGGENPAR